MARSKTLEARYKVVRQIDHQDLYKEIHAFVTKYIADRSGLTLESGHIAEIIEEVITEKNVILDEL